jgi:hypothetical protein
MRGTGIDSEVEIYALNDIRTHDPSVRTNEDGSCLRPRGQCDRHKAMNAHSNFVPWQ